MPHPQAAEAQEAFEALAPFATRDEADEAAYLEDIAAFESGACASHDALGCPLCGWTM